MFNLLKAYRLFCPLSLQVIHPHLEYQNATRHRSKLSQRLVHISIVRLGCFVYFLRMIILQYCTIQKKYATCRSAIESSKFTHIQTLKAKLYWFIRNLLLLSLVALSPSYVNNFLQGKPLHNI
jgi:hypothetical protein